jgi:hypothetical protein
MRQAQPILAYPQHVCHVMCPPGYAYLHYDRSLNGSEPPPPPHNPPPPAGHPVSYAYSALVTGVAWPLGVDPSAREAHLCAQEFLQVNIGLKIETVSLKGLGQ